MAPMFLNEDQRDVLVVLARRAGRGMTVDALAARTDVDAGRLRFALARAHSRGLVHRSGDRWRASRAGAQALAVAA